MKQLLLIFAVCIFNFSSAQYNINWKEAPLNQIPIPYKLEHFNLKGPVKALTGGRDLHFNNKGNLTNAIAVVSFSFTYDANNNPITYSSGFANDSKSIFQLKLDAKGRIKEKTGSNNSVYTYDSGGNWTGTFNEKGDRQNFSNIYTYDTKNRLIKSEFFNSSVIWIDYFTYAKDGEFLVINYSYENLKEPSKNYKRKNYYKNGFNYGSVKNDNFKFDQYGNPTVELDAKGNVFRTNETQYVYYTDSTLKQNPANTFTNPTEKPVIKNTNCLSGNCIDGFGTYKYNNGNYTGFFRAGKKDGFGIYQWTTGSMHTGNWKNDVNDGYGLFTGTDGNSYQGIFYKSKLNGLASHLKPDKTGNYGLYTNGQFTTKYNYFSNNITKGCTAGDCANGYGKFLFDDGGIYVGFFKNSSMLQGVWKGANGDSYTGEFGPNNTLEGYGNYKYKNGENYFGDYKNNKRNGRGILYNPATKVSRKGEWKDDVLVKEYLD